MWELTKSFTFEAAHTLSRDIEHASSRRIHGHSYRAEVTVAGVTDEQTGMIVDIGRLQCQLDGVQSELDHRFLDEVADIGIPTMENIARWIWGKLTTKLPNLVRVTIFRESLGERCTYLGPQKDRR